MYNKAQKDQGQIRCILSKITCQQVKCELGKPQKKYIFNGRGIKGRVNFNSVAQNVSHLGPTTMGDILDRTCNNQIGKEKNTTMYVKKASL